ncbi:MAG TPA: ankyrin repeat domain-containing protein [Terriglobia bacterium]|nr:ankyrin repeat domain-containing protein [Terriglobia bacterium]
MLKRCAMAAILGICVSAEVLFAQAPGKVDFGRDVQPIFKTYCVGCHGPTQQMNGFRLDRRRDAMKGGTIPVIGPGNSAGSRLYQRLIGSQYGLQMPPTGALKPEQIAIIKAWIDQGAEWPDALSGETPPPPPDPGATKLMAALREGDHRAFHKLLGANPSGPNGKQAVNRKGPGGSTPLMYAALYGDSDSVRQLLKRGADPNIRNEANATALMWAVGDFAKTRLLVEHGADVNARSDNGRTPLMIAATRFGSAPVVKLLLDHGADPNAQSPSLFGVMTPLAEAAYARDAVVIKMLLDRGASVKTAGFNPLGFAILTRCAQCVDLLIGSTSHDDLNTNLFLDAPPDGDSREIQMLLDHGADPNAKDPDGNTLLMLAAASDALPLELAKALIARGVDVNAKNPKGETALDFAKRAGHKPMVDLLVQAGAKESVAPVEAVLTPVPAHSVRAAVERSVPLLQRSDAIFLQKSGCVSCHNNTLTAMAVETARQSGIPVDDRVVSTELKTEAAYIEGWRERILQGVGIPGDSDTLSAILVGMAADKYPPDPATDAMAVFLRNHQSPNGQWYGGAHRPPLESSDIQVTALSMRAIQLYGPKAQRAEYDKSVQLAATWLTKARPKTTQDRAFQLLGLAWAEGDRRTIEQDAGSLLAEQRSDGGWAQLPSLGSDAFATGQALVALKESGALAATDPAYKRGTQFLLNTQLADGSWYVKRRALPIQPYFESGFPHGRDQFISAAATNWATTALALAAASPAAVSRPAASPSGGSD